MNTNEMNVRCNFTVYVFRPILGIACSLRVHRNQAAPLAREGPPGAIRRFRIGAAHHRSVMLILRIAGGRNPWILFSMNRRERTHGRVAAPRKAMMRPRTPTVKTVWATRFG